MLAVGLRVKTILYKYSSTETHKATMYRTKCPNRLQKALYGRNQETKHYRSLILKRQKDTFSVTIDLSKNIRSLIKVGDMSTPI